MTLPQIINRLRSAGVPDRFYVADGGLGAGECVGIEPVGDRWSIYYSERGRKSPLESHPTESAACEAFVRHVDRMMHEAGRGGLLGI